MPSGQDARIASRALGRPEGVAAVQPPTAYASAGVPLFCDGEFWRGLARDVHGAADVTFYGIVPRPLIEALRELLNDAQCAERVLPPITYYTPAPGEILSTYNERVRTRLALRWQVAFMGLRNLIDVGPQTGSSEEPATTALFSLPTSFSDCIVEIQPHDGEVRLRYLALLPQRAGQPEGTRFIEQVPHASEGGLLSYLHDLAADASPLRLREVLCQPVQIGGYLKGQVTIPDLPIAGLAPFAGPPEARPHSTMKPIAIVAVRCRHAGREQVLLKERNELEDTDQFGKLSLLSARVQEADLATALNLPLGNEDEESDPHDRLWVDAGEPDPFLLPVEAFRFAAMRELFLTCGLSLDPRRLEFDGLYVLDEGSQQLGFGVFHLELVRQSPRDERSLALRRNPHSLKAVPLGDLGESDGVHDLNRLLCHGRGWLLEKTLAPGRQVPRA